MLIRAFTRTTAAEVRPGYLIEQPKAMRVEEVHQTLDGLRIWGRRPHHDDSPRVSITTTPESVIELPMADQDTVVDLLRSLLAARNAADRDDDVKEPLDWSYDATERTFVVTAPELLSPLLLSFVNSRVEAPPAEKPKPARRKAAKAVTVIDPGKAVTVTEPDGTPD
jgi:hypothetical protein